MLTSHRWRVGEWEFVYTFSMFFRVFSFSSCKVLAFVVEAKCHEQGSALEIMLLSR